MKQIKPKTMIEYIIPAAHALEEKNFPADPWTEDMFRAALEDPATVFLTEQRGDDLAGLVIIRTIAGEGSIDNVSVDPAYRRQGIARKLVRFAYGDSGVSSLTVGCADCDQKMYGALGFSVRLGNLLAFE